MNLTLFDLDHTLLPLDTNQAWVSYLIAQGALQREPYTSGAEAMKARYLGGGVEPDVVFCEFFIQILRQFSEAELHHWRAGFVSDIIRPAITQSALQLIAHHRQAGDLLAIITATNRFITTPIADALGITHLIATECERHEQGFTGRVLGIPSMRSGKVSRLKQWLASGAVPAVNTLADLDGLRFYSDSINDYALLDFADEPIAVDPDPALRSLALARGWPIISLAM